MIWSSLSRWEPQALSVLRIVSAFLFMAHGTQKLFGFPAGPKPSPRPPLASLMGFGGLLEFGGGLLLLFGLFTRPVAFVLSGMMAVAYFMVHAPRGFWPVTNGGEPAALYCFVFLYFAFAGGGPWSVDYCLRRAKSRTDGDAR
jgi:putative oxidoreductase